MQHRGLPDDTWEAAFRHLASVVLGIEVIRCVQSIASSSCDALSESDIDNLDFSRLRVYRDDLPSRAVELREHLEDCLGEFEMWANNVHIASPPRFLPGDKFLKRMVALIQEQLPVLSKMVVFVYIDEFENLALYQQRVINSWMKHSEPPLIFNVAMKRMGFKTYETDGSESLSAIHDYRILDLEAFDLDAQFPAFAAEIFLLRLKMANFDVSIINPEQLRTIDQVASRKDAKYVRELQRALEAILPAKSHTELAAEVFKDQTLRRKLIERVNVSLKSKGALNVKPERVVDEKYAEASIVVPALLQRDALSVGEVVGEFEKLRAGSPNKFTGTTDWVHNNFVGCYLQLFDGMGRACPLYGGFKTFCYMARGNLRHFLELCHKALSRAEKAGGTSSLKISVESQAAAARQVATDLLPEIRSFGPQGNNLYTFALRLGSLFSLSQQSPPQSEPERTHFSITDGQSALNERALKFLKEAVKWSVLFEEKITKKKDAAGEEGIEYVLNPIYSASFHISYRKRRKLELKADSLHTLIEGDRTAMSKLLKSYQRRWSVDLEVPQRSLFAHLAEEAEE
jgi:hypothetical protein